MKKEFKKYDVEKFSNFREVLDHAVRDDGDKAAFKYREKGKVKSVLYREFRDETYFLGTALAKDGIDRKRVACVGDNCYRWLVVYITMLNSAGVFIPLDRQLPPSDKLNVLNHSETEVLFYAKKYEKEIDEIRESLTCVKRFVCIDKPKPGDGFEVYDDLIAEGKAMYDGGNRDYITNTGDTNALRVLVYTSGTTGMAKGVMLSEKNIVSCIYNGMKISRLFDRAISVLPYHHTYEACGILAALNNHATIGINDNIRNLMKNFEEYKPESVYLVPSFLEIFYKKIMKQAGARKNQLFMLISISDKLRKIGIDLRRVFFASILKPFGGDLKKIVCGGAPLRAETAAFFDSIGVNVVNGYGITECAPLVSITRDNYDDCSTSGVPIDCITVRIENKDSDGIGAICVKGDSVMLGYYKNEEETKRVMKDGWFNTGDLGYIDSVGRIVITGRKKNMIVLKNGKNVFPEEIEDYIMSIPYVKETVVTVHKNNNGEESGLCAHIVLEPETDTADIENRLRHDIDEVCSPLPHYKHITKIDIRKEEFAKTTSNKIKRAEI